VDQEGGRAMIDASSGPARFTLVEARGMWVTVRATAVVALVATLVLAASFWLAFADRARIPAAHSVAVLHVGLVLVLAVLVRLTILCLEIQVHPAVRDHPGRAAGPRLTLAAVAAAGCLVALGWAVVAWWQAMRVPVTADVPLPSLRGLLPVTLVLAVLSLAAAGATLLTLRPQQTPGRGRPAAERGSVWPVADQGGEVICCSGGGIRSASFCLGALQALDAAGRYSSARAVFAVSGGSWIATAFHVLHRQLGPAGTPAGPHARLGLFAPSSPELRRFRRDTRYLSSSARQRVLLAFSFVLGLGANLLLVIAVLRIAAWLIGWALAQGRAVTCVVTAGVAGGRPGADPCSSAVAWSWLDPVTFGLWLLAASGVVFALGWLLDTNWVLRLLRQHDPVPALREAAVVLLPFGAVGVLIWPGIPLTGVAFGALAERLHGTVLNGAVGVVAGWLNGTGLSTLPGVLGGVVALVGLVRSSLKGPGTGTETTRQSIIAFIRQQVAPWLGSLLVLGGGYLLLALWSLTYARGFAAPAGRPVAVVDWAIWVALVSAFVLPRITNANRTTLYPYYRDSLAEAYLMRRSGDEAAPLPRLDLPGFAALGHYEHDAHRRVRPELVLCATANISDPRVVPTGRRATSFLFASNRGICMPDGQLPGGPLAVPAASYRTWDNDRNTTAAAAMAISGAAVAPVAGRENMNVTPYRLLMTLTNLRLGVWLRNPYWVASGPAGTGPLRYRLGTAAFWHWLVQRVGDLLQAPGPGMILQEGLGRTSLYSRYLYVTDGGHLDNLGLVEALRSRPESVIVLDASADEEDTFLTLANAIATARMDLDVELDGFDIARMRRDGGPTVHHASAQGKATWPDGHTCRILYVKALFPVGASVDLQGYRSQHKDFPVTGTTDQLYDEFDLEAFRQLGSGLTEDALRTYPLLRVIDLREPVPVAGAQDPGDGTAPR
jgi:hypothetical protein